MDEITLIAVIDDLPPVMVFPPIELSSSMLLGVNRSGADPDAAAALDLVSASLAGQDTPQVPEDADSAALHRVKDWASRLNRPEFRALLRHIWLSSLEKPGREWELAIGAIDDYLDGVRKIQQHPKRHTFSPSLVPLPHLIPVVQMVRNAAELAVSTGQNKSFEQVVDVAGEIIEQLLNDPGATEPLHVLSLISALKVRKPAGHHDLVLTWFEQAEIRWPSPEHKAEIMKERWEWEKVRKGASADDIETLAIRYVERRLQQIATCEPAKQVGSLSWLLQECQQMNLKTHDTYDRVRFRHEVAQEQIPLETIRMELPGLGEVLTRYGQQLADQIERATSLAAALRLIVWDKTPAEYAPKPEMPEGILRLPTEYQNPHGHTEFRVPQDRVDVVEQQRNWLLGIDVFGLPLADQLDAVHRAFQPTRDDLKQLLPKLSVNRLHDYTEDLVQALLDYWSGSTEQAWSADHWASLVIDGLAREILRANEVPIRKAPSFDSTKIERAGGKSTDDLIKDLTKTDFPPSWAEMMLLLASHPVSDTETGKEPNLGFNQRNAHAHLWATEPQRQRTAMLLQTALAASFYLVDREL
ncbi:hypothetical protein [Natronoglycomyces albus]|uniref:Uncharacterized protein n=1 Tax=Natronoglycomyces albus TaxID=2811108 RepID=A0A895XLX7_9ACTN|nr:hypothetical protein [Natronoglycomyces albus]QSB03965.1 hypothetical protein JQS30_09015 [Natronoglycomyces albus]